MLKQRVKATLRWVVGTLVGATLGVLYILFTFCGLHAELWAKQWNTFLFLALLYYAFIVPGVWVLIWRHQTAEPDEVSKENADPYMVRLSKTGRYVLFTIIVISVLMQIIIEWEYEHQNKIEEYQNKIEVMRRELSGEKINP